MHDSAKLLPADLDTALVDMTGDCTITALLEAFQDCKKRGECATLFLETRNGMEFAHFKVNLSGSQKLRTSRQSFPGHTKKKSPSTLKRDKDRLETFMKKKTLQETWSPKETSTPLKPGTPALDNNTSENALMDKAKQTNDEKDDSSNEPIIEKPDESKTSQEDALRTYWECIENKEAWLADFKQVCEESVKRATNNIQDIIQNNDVIEEDRPDNEENDCLEDVKKWTMKQKQSIISD